MSDVMLNPEAPTSPEHVTTYRKDYREPDWLVPEVALDFELNPERTRVHSTLKVVRNGDHDRPLRLAGNDLAPLAVRANDTEPRWKMDGNALVIDLAGNEATI
jgi:aminopeptidase N